MNRAFVRQALRDAHMKSLTAALEDALRPIEKEAGRAPVFAAGESET